MMSTKNPTTARAWRVAAWISLSYALVASIWIYASDRLLARLSDYPPALISLQTYKGWLFVAITTLLLYGLIDHLLTREYALRPAAGPSDTLRIESAPLIPSLWQGIRLPVLIFLALAGAISSLGYLVYAQQEHALQTAKAEELRWIADDKAAGIDHWLAERRRNAEFIARDPLLGHAVGRWFLTSTPAADEGQRLEQWLTALKETFGYTAVLLLDTEGQVRLGVGIARLHPQRQGLVRQALASGQVVLSDLYWCQERVGSPIDLDLIAPLPGPADGQPPLGALVLKIDPGQYLFPVIQAWLTTSPSAEILLVRREREEVVYLNEPRHRQGTALRLRLPLASEELPAARAVRGEQGVVEGVDYRQVPVLAALRAVPGTAWFLIVKIDAEEVFAPLRTLMFWVAVVGSLLVVAAGTGTTLWWRQQHTGLVAESYRRELERQALAQRFDYLSKYANDSILLMDSQGQIQEANERAVATYGYSREELRRLNIGNLRASQTQATEELARVAHSNGLVFETVHYRKDGSCFPVEVSARQINIQGQSYQQSIIRDISERQRAEEALRESEERLASILGSLLDGVITVDERQCITLLNPAAERLFGYRAVEVLGQPLDRLIPERFRAAHAEHVRAFGQSNVTHRKMSERAAVSGRRADGEEFPVEAAISQTEVAGQKLFTVILRDITERRRAEDALTKRTEELARSNKDLEQFAYAASHDLQEPLRAVAGCVQLLRKHYQGQLDERADELIAHAVEGAQRMRQLIDDLLAFSRVGTRGGPLQPVDGEAALAAALANLTVAIHESRAVITHDPLPTVTADPTQLTLLLQNLIGNAIKFRGEESPRIHVGARRQGHDWVLSVRDNGIGIEPQYFERIFAVFQRLHTRREYAGTGIGLAICKKIVERHGGRIWVESAPGAGCTFHCSLPDVRIPTPFGH